MSKYDDIYLEGLSNILEYGNMIDNDRTGEKCLTVPRLSFTYDNSFVPLPTVKQGYAYPAWAEMLGYLRQYEWADDFDRIGAKTWYANSNSPKWQSNEFCEGTNHMGKVYGAVLEKDYVRNIFDNISNHKDNRGLILDFWKEEDFDKGCLRPCLYNHQFTILDDTLYLDSNQRSCDYTLGKPFNAFSLWMLLKYVSDKSGLKMGSVRHNVVNAHIYESHIENAEKMLSVDREPISNEPVIKINEKLTLEDIFNDKLIAKDFFTVENYKHHGKLHFDMIV